MGDAIESLRESPAYAPVGILLGAGLWYGIRNTVNNLKLIEARDLMNSILAVIFTGMYIYLWTQEDDPHSGEVKPNEFMNELPLILAAGSYLLDLYPLENGVRAAHSVLAVAIVADVLLKAEGASLAIVYSFLFHLPELFLAIKNYMNLQKMSSSVADIMGYLYLGSLVLGVAGMAYTTYNVIMTDGNDAVVQGSTVLYTLLSAGMLYPAMEAVSGGGGHRSRRGRSRSCRRRESRSKSTRRR